ncbi:jerky protein-like [Diabrotica undecimpunctata]|uniref:jerky protein-like n=1 Tax=Diabrotica undecimpunctata TaxID=50387 RepID=UPI003B63C10D
MDKKLDALNRIDRGEPLNKLAAELGVRTSCVGLENNRKNIEDVCFKMISKDSLQGRGTTKKAKNELLDETLFMWYSAQRERVVPFSGLILSEKAANLNKKLPNPDPSFTASQGFV